MSKLALVISQDNNIQRLHKLLELIIFEVTFHPLIAKRDGEMTLLLTLPPIVMVLFVVLLKMLRASVVVAVVPLPTCFPVPKYTS